jgi:hypothetical protein
MSRWIPSTHHLLILIMRSPGKLFAHKVGPENRAVGAAVHVLLELPEGIAVARGHHESALDSSVQSFYILDLPILDLPISLPAPLHPLHQR